MRLVCVAMSLCVGLAGCNAPGAYFHNVPPTRVMIEGATFDVRYRNRLAEANRIDARIVPRFDDVALKAARAMRVVSGCDVAEVRGDAAQITGVLLCDAGQVQRPPTGTELYDCVVIDRWSGEPDVLRIEDYDCAVLPF